MRGRPLTIIFLLLAAIGQSQVLPFGDERMEGFLNKRSFQPGEILRLSLVNFDENNLLSNFSKIGYVELLDSEGQSLLKTKLALTGGLGDGKLFIPTALSSGRYALVAYTQWMANFGMKGAFTSFVTIVNPYKPLKLAPFKRALTSDSAAMNGVNNVLPLDKNYPPKTRVTLDFNPSSDGIITVSVHRLDSISFFALNGSPTYVNTIAKQFYLPDYRGELITGKFKSPDKTGNDQVFMSIPQYDNQVRVTQTDSSGRFVFINHQVLDQEEIWFSVEKRQSGEFEYDDRFIGHHFGMIFDGELSIDSAIMDHIKRRSIEIQLENAYSKLYVDSVATHKPVSGFGEPLTVYRLDDYTRFKSVGETVKEYINQVAIRKRNGKNRFFLLNAETGARQIPTPLLLLNGFPIFDPEILIKYNPFDIEKIEIINTPYIFGQLEYGGILNFVTFQKPLTETIEGQQNFKAQNIGVQPLSYFRKQPNDLDEHHPDFRSQVLWQAHLPVKALSSIPIEFVTSELKGHYEMVIWEMDMTGKSQIYKTTFLVK